MISNKAAILRDTLFYTLANYVAQILGVVNSIVLRRFMGPTSMGIWSLLQVILGYCGYANLGATKAMARDYPYLRGKGENTKAECLKDMTLTFSMWMSILPATVILLYLKMRWSELETPLRLGLMFLAVFLFLQRFYDLVINLLRSDKQFELLSQVTIVNAIGGLAISFLLVYPWNIYGLLAGTVLVTLGCLGWINKFHRYRFRYFWDTEELWKELKLGIPLVVASSLLIFLKSMDKLIISGKLGFFDLGLYSIAVMAHSYVMALPMMFSHVWYPNLQEAYGRKENPQEIRDYLTSPVFILAVIVPFSYGLLMIIVPVIVYAFLPKFVAGLAAMKIYLVSSFFLLLGEFGNSFLVTVNKYLYSIPVLAVSILVNYCVNLSLIERGWGLQGVALGTTLSCALYGISVFYLALRQTGAWRTMAPMVAQSGVIALCLTAGAFATDAWVQFPSFYASQVLKVGVYFGFSIPFFWILEKQTRILSQLRLLLGNKFQPQREAAFLRKSFQQNDLET